MPLDLTTLEKAAAQLEGALRYARDARAKGDAELALHLRAGAIQAFEFTYELAFKVLKRALKTDEVDPSAVDDMSFDRVVRRAYDLGLIRGEPSLWQGFRRDRGTTSHAYDELKAAAVFTAIPEFLDEGRFLIQGLERRGESV